MILTQVINYIKTAVAKTRTITLTKFLEYISAATLLVSVTLTSFNVYPLNLYVNIFNTLLYIWWSIRIGAKSQVYAQIIIIIIPLWVLTFG